jgi:hypothetical protein
MVIIEGYYSSYHRCQDKIMSWSQVKEMEGAAEGENLWDWWRV